MLITVLIPCRNEAAFIGPCLESVLAFERAGADLEVLVIDGMSRDGTPAVVQEWMRNHPEVKLLENPQGIVPTALNLGIEHARGEYILRLDAHSEYPKDYLKRCMDVSQKSGAANVGGIVITLSRGKTLAARLVQAVTTHLFGVGNAGFRLAGAEGPTDTVPFGFFRTAIFKKVGRFDERLVRNQDYEFNRRIIAAGDTIWRDPEIQASYYNQGTIKGLMRQARVTGMWNPWMWLVAPYSFSYRHMIPALFAGGLCMAAFGSLFSSAMTVLLVAILAPYLALACLAAAQQARRYGLILFPFLPPLFLWYHLSYGLGTVWGVCRLLAGTAPVQHQAEPWVGAGHFRSWAA